MSSSNQTGDMYCHICSNWITGRDHRCRSDYTDNIIKFEIKNCAICGCDINELDSSGRGFGVMLLGYKEQGKVETYCNPCIVNKLWAYDKLVKQEEDKKEK